MSASIWIDASGTGHSTPGCTEFYGQPDMPVSEVEAINQGVIVVCADCEPQE